MKALLTVRFRSLAAMFIQRGTKKKGIGTTILFSFLYLYLGAVGCGMSGFLFYTLAEPYHMLGLDWLYFSMAGLMALGLAVFGSIFTTQNQLYEAKDNALLLSMPIQPGKILLSRMIPLLAINLLFASIVMVPAIVVYAVWVGFSPLMLIMQLLSIPAVALLAQAFACILGWLLHLAMSRINKSLASVLYMVIFLAAYWGIYYNANSILTSMISNSQAIAEAMNAWVWPIYALGKGCIGSLWHGMAAISICAILFAMVYGILTATFLRTATMSHTGKKRKTLRLNHSKVNSPIAAIVRKELGKFVATPVYLTNMGLGILLVPALVIAGILFRNKIKTTLALLMLTAEQFPLLICAILSFLISTMCISTPAVSLEGKNLWIMKSMPVSPKDVLCGKLVTHILLTVPVCLLGGFTLALAYGCSPAGILLCSIIPTLLALLNGLVGMTAGLKWAKFDYVNEAYPCKQSISVLVSMFGIMGLPFVLGLVYVFVLSEHLSATVFLLLSAILLALLCHGFYQLMIRWGTKKWTSF